MDDNDRRRLQRLYDAASTSSTVYTSDAHATSNNLEVDDILRHQQTLLQQEIASASASGSQPSVEQMDWLLRNNPTQQLHEMNNYEQPSLDRISAMSTARVLQQSIDQMADVGTATQPGQTTTEHSISLLMRNIQQQNNKIEHAVQNQRYRDLMLNAAVARGDIGNAGIDIRSLLSDTMGMPYLDERQFNTFGHQQYQNLSSTQNIPLLSETDLMLSRAQANVAQHNLPLSTYGTTDSDLTQQLLMDEYLRAQQNDLRVVSQAYQSQQLLESYSGRSRLAFLIQQRQQLERQPVDASLPASRNISLKNDELVDDEELEVTKIRKIEAFIEKPKRPLSAYNIFFRQERQKMLADDDNVALEGNSEAAKDGDDHEDKKPAAVVEVMGNKKRKRGKPHHKVTFEQMAKIIGQRWKELESDESKKKHYQDIAQKDKERYQTEIAAWKQQRHALSSKYRKKNDTP